MKKLLFFGSLSTLLFVFACSKSDDNNNAPVLSAGFSFLPANPKVGETVVFINESQNATTFSWEFGDGTTSTERNPTKSYATEGTFKVKLTATSGSQSKMIEKNVIVGLDVNALVVLEGKLTTQTLNASRKYLLKGLVEVPDGVTLTVPAGTIVFGEKATKGGLVVNRGGKLIAEGTKEKPIVFTSNQEEGARDKGDWLGIIMLGKATTNQANPSIEGLVGFNFGGNDDNDNSGSLKYVRIEFAGIEFTPNNETNSLTMGGLGKGTSMDYVQVSFGGDDGFEWFGGTVDGKHLISFGIWDDDFDCDFGWRGKVQYGLGVRYPSFADQSGSVFFEIDNDAQGSTQTPFTAPVFSNMTLIGPRHLNQRRDNAGVETRRASSINANFTQAVHLRRNSEAGIYNSVITGYPNGVRIDDAATLTKYEGSTIFLAKNYLIMPGGTNFVTNVGGKTGTDVQAVWNKATGDQANVLINPGTSASNRDVVDFLDSLGLRTSTSDAGVFFGSRLDINYPTNPDYTVAAGKPLRSGASFTNPKLTDAYFDKVSYIGAFSDTDWTDGWAEFRPKVKQY